MRNAFSNLYTPGQWLLSSVCWTLGIIGGWLLVIYVLFANLPASADEPIEFFLFGSAAAMHLLLWRKAVAGGREVIGRQQKTLISRIILTTWMTVLIAFQVLCILLWLLALALACDKSGLGSWD